jgi:Flp pilus assembly protein TadB
MPDENPETTPAEEGSGLGDQARALRDDLSPSRINENLEQKVSDRPLLAHLLDLGIVARAVALAVVVALLAWLIVGPATAAFFLLVVYFGAWYILARMSYSRRRQTRPADSESDADSDAE